MRNVRLNNNKQRTSTNQSNRAIEKGNCKVFKGGKIQTIFMTIKHAIIYLDLCKLLLRKFQIQSYLEYPYTLRFYDVNSEFRKIFVYRRIQQSTA